MSRGHRGSTTPMDFEWSNQSGPVDPNSPFFASQQSAKKRPHSVLDSPSRNAFATPNRPQLRDPDGRTYLFDQSGVKPLPSIPSHVQSAWEPRTPASTYDFSSGGETPTTPQVDSDAGTPDTQMANKLGRLATGDASSPKKAGRRDSWFKRTFMSNQSPSPTKERDKDPSQKYYSKKAENRIVKRRSERSERSRSKKRMALRDDDDTDSEHTAGATKDRGPVQRTYAMSIAGFLSWIEAHPNLPSVLSYYLQLTVNASLGFLFLYIVYSAWCAVVSDVEIEASKYASEIMVEIAACAAEYKRNRCRPEEVVPALEKACGIWETCMDRDPRKVARASVTAKTFAMIFNSFVEEFSYKSMIFSFLLIFGGFNLSNWAFGLLRSSTSKPSHNVHPNDFIPQTPQRVPSNSYLDYNHQAYQQNWQNHTPYQTPYTGMRHIEAPPTHQQQQQPPPLLHSQSMPVVPGMAHDAVSGVGDEKRGVKKRGLFR
ncbi:Di-sulfide bridge nucleocytoplasmic transport domain-containing protein [Pyrenochaeta sp. MPI-SDFR-AT-0127]|nr:Di-sulfide bridge nucleocytoplasmic transport domain-containing protein [Pyrenochaeta sp. MPI-SDFR-AT-0127]